MVERRGVWFCFSIPPVHTLLAGIRVFQPHTCTLASVSPLSLSAVRINWRLSTRRCPFALQQCLARSFYFTTQVLDPGLISLHKDSKTSK